MYEGNNNTRVLFTTKANSALDDIIKKFSLEETSEEFTKKLNEGKLSNIVLIDHLVKDFATQKITENDLEKSLQKNLEVNQQTTEQITKEIINKIIPFLVKAPEEKFKDSSSLQEIARKVFGESTQAMKTESKISGQEDNDTFPKIQPPQVAEKPKIITAPPISKIRKPTLPKNNLDLQTEETKKRSKGPDRYREPIQ